MIRRRFLALACVLGIQLIDTGAPLEAQQAAPVEVAGTQVFEAIRLLTSYAEVGLPNDDTIKGDRTFDGPVLAANMLTFEPGSRLIFTAAAGDKAERYIFARSIKVPGPATITWDRELTGRRYVAPVGKALPGGMGGGDGGDGAVGPNGQTGNPGYPGRSAPTIYIVTNRIDGAPVTVDLRGQDGGEGGVGQTGGDGGGGRTGDPAVAILGVCRSPGGSGGRGGAGGNGGTGGEGGRGGNGGTLVLLAPVQSLERLAQSLNVDIRPGRGGEGGKGGEPGRGGEGGGSGRPDRPCPPGKPGQEGAPGQKGADGPSGDNGQFGAFAKTALTEQQARSLQLRGASKK